MDGCKVIIFKEDINNPGMGNIAHKTKLWYELNKDKIKNIHSIYSQERDLNSPSQTRKILIIHYEGEAGINPFECSHENTHIKIIEYGKCGETGIKGTFCKNCKLLLNKFEFNIGDHIYTETSNNDATCTEDGTKTCTCDICGEVTIKPDTGSVLGHDYIYTINNDATCTEDGTKTCTCSRCDLNIIENNPGSKLGHSYPNEWTIRTNSTETSEGIKFKKCIRCDNEIIQYIPKLNHQWISNGNGTHKCITPNGCNNVETCSPNGYGEICSKCGYHTPEDINLSILTTYINGMTKGSAFSQTLQCNTSSNYTWSLLSGTLPSGISLSSNGVLSGTPTVSGMYTFTIQVSYHDQVVNKEFSVNVANIFITVTFNANGGTTSETSRQIAQGGTIGDLPTATRNGYEFGGWFTAQTGGLKVDSSYSVASDTTLYARWGQSSGDLVFGDATTQFNIQVDGDRTNYSNNPYTLYHRYSNGSTSNLTIQTTNSSSDNTNSNNMTDSNKTIKLYMKVTNNGEAGYFDIGFDCDSYVTGNDSVLVERLSNGVKLTDDVSFTVTVPYETSVWIGKYSSRVDNRYNNVDTGYIYGVAGSSTNSADSGYAFTMNNIFINSGSYTILEVTFQKI